MMFTLIWQVINTHTWQQGKDGEGREPTEGPEAEWVEGSVATLIQTPTGPAHYDKQKLKRSRDLVWQIMG